MYSQRRFTATREVKGFLGSINHFANPSLFPGKESEKLNAVPHFAGLSLTAMTGSDNQEGDSTEGGAYEVIFNGMTVVR